MYSYSALSRLIKVITISLRLVVHIADLSGEVVYTIGDYRRKLPSLNNYSPIENVVLYLEDVELTPPSFLSSTSRKTFLTLLHSSQKSAAPTKSYRLKT